MKDNTIALLIKRFELLEAAVASLGRWQGDVIDDAIREEEYKAALDKLVAEHTFKIRELEAMIQDLIAHQVATDVWQENHEQEPHRPTLTAAERAYLDTQERYPGIYPKRTDSM